MIEAFDAYVAPARNGPRGFWRVIVGLALLFVAMVLGAALGVSLLFGLGYWPPDDVSQLFAALASLIAIIPALWLVTRWLHRRRFRTLLGVGGRLRLRGVIEGALLILVVGVGSNQLAQALGWVENGPAAPASTPLWMIAVLALLIPIQSAAEELAFRGYLVQELAARTRFVLVWLLPPAVLFAALHVSPDRDVAENMRFLTQIGLFAVFASGLVWLTGGLSHAIGVHAANNLLALLVFRSEFGLEGVGWIATRTQAGAEAKLLLVDVASYLLALGVAALLFKREPLAARAES